MRDLAMRWTSAQPTVAAFISGLVPDHHDAEDLLQRTAASLVTTFHKYDAKQPFAAWAIGVARIEVLRYRQERGRERLVFDDETISRIADAYAELAPELEEMRRVLDGCIRKLKGRMRRVLELHFARELAPAAIARELETTANAVFVMLHRARSLVRRCLESQLGPLPGAGRRSHAQAGAVS